MHYRVHDHTKRGKVFATLEEAITYADYIMRNTGWCYAITETKSKATHEIACK